MVDWLVSMNGDNHDGAWIRIAGARQNNLKNIDLRIPINRLTVITGVSGSGKSSLAFDTLYAEGQRRYVESLSAYARQFLERIRKPLVREIEGLSPAIAIRQKTVSRNPRSTVGTVTEIYDHLRLVYARIGTLVCRGCGRQVKRDTVEQAVRQLLRLPEGARLFLCFSLSGSSFQPEPGAPSRELAGRLMKQGFHRLVLEAAGRLRVVQVQDGLPASDLSGARVLVDRVVVRDTARQRLSDSLETCFHQGGGAARISVLSKDGRSADRELEFTQRLECQYCRISYRVPEPRLFSFNNPYGACPTCHGFGSTITLDPDLIIPDQAKTLAEGPVDPFNKPRYRRFGRKLQEYALREGIPLDVPYRELPETVRRRIWDGSDGFPGVKGFFAYLERKKYKMHIRILISRYRGYTRCADCSGERLCQEARDVQLGGRRISQLTSMPIQEIQEFFRRLRLDESQRAVADSLLREIRQRLDFLMKVGLDYLTLDRITSTLSGGEMQRIQLAAALGSSLTGTLYVLDEPSVGLHPRDTRRLISILRNLRDLGNTIVVVEHEREMIESADQVVDMGPGPGEHGGHVVYSGGVDSLRTAADSLTAQYLRGERRVPTPFYRRSLGDRFVTVRGARQHNLKNLDVRLPLGLMVCITGVSGSGKSTLVGDVIYAGLKKQKSQWKGEVGKFDSIEGAELVDEILLVDQSPIGKSPRSNPVTYLKAFDEIRQIFASQRASQRQNLRPGHFSFNIPGGRCETCDGAGFSTVNMQFLADVELMCEDCRGARYKSTILDIGFRGKNIAQVLDLTVTEALEFFRSFPRLSKKLKVLEEVGLGYVKLGQASTTLSGGEAQRIKLASYLAKSTRSDSIFILDEPTTGLHFDDIQKLLRALDRLISKQATVVIIEHNMDVIRSADWVIDLGPEGGDKGGFLVAEGTPETIARTDGSYTGQFLRQALERP